MLSDHSRQEWEQMINELRAENQCVVAKAWENPKIVATAGPLYLFSNDDFSSFFLFKKHATTKKSMRGQDYSFELVVAEYPGVLRFPGQSVYTDVINRQFGYSDLGKRINFLLSKNEKQKLYAGQYTIITPRGTISFSDTEGYGTWDILHDGINNRTYYNEGLCWVEEDTYRQSTSSNAISPVNQEMPNGNINVEIEPLDSPELLDNTDPVVLPISEDERQNQTQHF